MHRLRHVHDDLPLRHDRPMAVLDELAPAGYRVMAVKCDLCPDRPVPACVTACPTGAILFMEGDAFAPRRAPTCQRRACAGKTGTRGGVCSGSARIEETAMERSISPDSIMMIKAAKSAGVTLAWDRYEAQLPQCGFGETGLCCRHCSARAVPHRPLRHDRPKLGICGANADTIVGARLARSIAGGTASHSAHAKHLAHTLLKWSRGEAPDYGIKDHAKFDAVLARVGIARDGKSDQELAGELAQPGAGRVLRAGGAAGLAQDHHHPGPHAEARQPGAGARRGSTPAWPRVMHRTTNGVDADAVNVLLGAIKCAIGDYTGMYLGTDLSDILFGTPAPVLGHANLGCLKADAVNIAVHGHNPVLSEVILAEAERLKGEAEAAGAAAGSTW